MAEKNTNIKLIIMEKRSQPMTKKDQVIQLKETREGSESTGEKRKGLTKENNREKMIKIMLQRQINKICSLNFLIACTT